MLDEEFDRAAALGSFAGVYGQAWAGYDGWDDTSRNLGRPVGSRGRYDSALTVSVAGGAADVWVHTADCRPYVVALTPPGPAGTGQLYGRYEVRFRADVTAGYKVAWLLWPVDERWADGELDFPEAALGRQVHGYAHQVDGDPSVNEWQIATGATMTGWHTAVLEWTPARLTYRLDGRSWSTTDPRAIPRTPMRWVLQTETQLSPVAPPVGAGGHVQLDYVRAWSYRS